MEPIIDESVEPESPAIYKHTRRPKWGLAILAFDHYDKRGFQFEDGKLRVFKKGFFHLMKEVDLPMDKTAGALRRLDRALGRNQAVEARGGDLDDLLSFDDQLTIFRALYPEGFLGKRWTETMRGEGAKRPLKRHRQPVLEAAAKLLAFDRLQGMQERGEALEILRSFSEVLEMTNLVTAGQRRHLEKLPEHRVTQCADAVCYLLHGSDPVEQRFDAFVTAFDGASWELCTTAAALVHPGEHVCVKPSAFTRQAHWMAPRLKHSRTPGGRLYLRYLSMARAVEAQLKKAGLQPRDLLDVYDFIWTTLRPSARKVLEEHKAEQDDSDQAAA